MAPKRPQKKSGRKKSPQSSKTVEATDSTAEFERLLKEVSDGENYVLRLFVTGTTARSAGAIENIHALCEEYLRGRYKLEVIDIYQQPNAAAADQIIAAPTLVKELPEPAQRLIGDLSDPGRVLVGLKLATPEDIKTKWLKV